MTPLAVNIMIECYCTSTPGANIPTAIWSSNAAQRERARLVNLGLIYKSTHRATKLGMAWVEAICATPIPTDGP